jgi:hypothetical protein
MQFRRFFATAATGIFLAAAAAAGPAVAQAPSPAAMASAKELIALKGATNLFDPVVPGVIEQAKGTFLRTNPSLAKDLNEVAAALRNEYANKRTEVHNIIARALAERFTEQELRDAVAFYKTPLGAKLIAQEAPAMEEGMSRLQRWADQLSEQVIGRFRAEMKKRGHAI